ncbi:hypothetical protein [Paraburkholderia sp. J11-2]|uniref:hypothetical protein n=1 Tax=Paraburkholderia sp. J11-2 TaxID=2805431 RepID=UPI002AB7D358|nr:hypothetical protein [Paraburkholderia sp. J11-2]
MKSQFSISALSVLLAFVSLRKTEQDHILAQVNKYLLASPVQRRTMVKNWKVGAGN